MHDERERIASGIRPWTVRYGSAQIAQTVSKNGAVQRVVWLPIAQGRCGSRRIARIDGADLAKVYDEL